MYDVNAGSERRFRQWFVRFRSGNFDVKLIKNLVKDATRSGRSVTENVDEILLLVEQNWHTSCQEIAEAHNINQMIVWDHLKRADYRKNLAIWVPHELAQRNVIDRITMSEILLKRNKTEPFLKRIITSDEKWVKCENIKHKR
ncbi:histone-lysine N-methyltransferase SETMAR-like [Stegodyphus dumicola]|uniref:histone-lysine N-methyltransferase SETMAR-like n=1 Tax=Stegodyphus dumicola TaxID=202533 RepID=UPI0015B18511|nr:histone-lysine N-methyltransferase SETMAR-like [Stegodyphus dumicola]